MTSFKATNKTLVVFYLLWRAVKLVRLPHEDKCTCLPIHPQQGFCHSDFVIRAKVQEQLNTSIKLHGNETKSIRAKYKIQIQAIWKGRHFIQSLRHGSSKSSHFEALVYTKLTKCPLFLTVGKKYILSGNIVNGKLYTSKCHWYSLWNAKSKRIRKTLRQRTFHCRCVIEPCFSKGTCRHNDPFVCNWPIRFKQRNCKFRTCKYDGGGCRWNKYVDMDLCDKRKTK